MRDIASPSKLLSRPMLAAGALLVLGWGISGSTSPQVSGAQGPVPTHRPWFQVGRASWYGGAFQGQPTASGQAFDLNRMTCAHRDLPLGALLRVTNLRNHRSVIVLVNDRGPLVRNRIVDLSYGAAKKLGFRGMARVRLDLVDASPTPQEAASLLRTESSLP